MTKVWRRDEFPVSYGKYTLLERLGFGGMAEVFRAELRGPAGFHKPLAIKRILPHLAETPDVVERFVAEAKVLASLEHPNVVSVYELGQIDDEYFIAMELISGVDLLEVLRATSASQTKIPVAFALHVALELLSALTHAHTRVDERGRPLGIVHRDVSPSNVFFSWQGAVKLGDFGVAKTYDFGPATKYGMVIGKLNYSAPETFNGSGELDGRVDVFGAGVILWEMLAQRRLFGGDHAYQVAAQIQSAPRPPPSRYNSDVSPALDAVVLRAIEPDPRLRPASALEFGEALRQAEHSLGLRASSADVAALVASLDDAAQRARLDPLSPDHRGFGEAAAIKSFAVHFVDPIDAPTVRVADPSQPPQGRVGDSGFEQEKTAIDPRIFDAEVDAPSEVHVYPPDESEGVRIEGVVETDDVPVEHADDEDVWVELSMVNVVRSDPTPPRVALIEDLKLDDLVILSPAPAPPPRTTFWYRAPGAVPLGPLELDTLEPLLVCRRGSQLSLDGHVWRELPVLFEDRAPDTMGRGSGAAGGLFPRESPVAVLCRLARARATGVLEVDSTHTSGVGWSLSVRLFEGRIAAVGSSRLGDGVTEILRRTRDIPPRDLVRLVASAVREDVPLLDLTAAVLQVPTTALRADIYKARLSALFAPEGARFAFAAGLPPAVQPPSLDARPILVDVLAALDSPAVSTAALAAFAGKSVAFARSFVPEIRTFSLTPAQERFLRALAEGRRPELGSDAREELAIANVLFASGLLLPVDPQDPRRPSSTRL